MAGMKNIAEMAGVSVSTVSNVLNGRANVGPETRERILKLCSEHGYYPRALRNKADSDQVIRRILFIFSDFDRDFYLKMINGISDYLTEMKYDLLICTNKSGANFMRSNFASGAISLDGSVTDEFLISAAKPDFPIVLMDRIIRNERANTKSVIVDNYPVMCQMVQALADKGFQRFGFIGGDEKSLDNQERFAAMTDTLEKNHIVFDRKFYFHGNYRESSGYQAAKIMILSHAMPEVLVCANDNMAIGAIRAFEENNIRVPEHISVTGFDDSDAAAMAGLTTISIPRYESGYLAAKQLLELIEGTAGKEPFKLGASIQWRRTVM